MAYYIVLAYLSWQPVTYQLTPSFFDLQVCIFAKFWHCSKSRFFKQTDNSSIVMLHRQALLPSSDSKHQQCLLNNKKCSFNKKPKHQQKLLSLSSPSLNDIDFCWIESKFFLIIKMEYFNFSTIIGRSGLRIVHGENEWLLWNESACGGEQFMRFLFLTGDGIYDHLSEKFYSRLKLNHYDGNSKLLDCFSWKE